MISVVIDTNIVISGIFWQKTAPDFVLGLIPQQKITAVLSDVLLEEIVKTTEHIARQYGFSLDALKTWEKVFKRYARWAVDLPEVKICRDPKDNMILATAVAGNAEYITTGDKDLLDLKRYKKIKIVTAQRFLREAVK